ncbi:MAG: DUF3185 family protein [bacterium]|nr:MAG: DUF3185 family protein [bacterium]
MIRRSIALGFIVFGAVLLYLGYDMTQSVVGELTRTFSGTYPDKTMAYLVGGGILVLAGLVLLFGRKRKGGRS